MVPFYSKEGTRMRCYLWVIISKGQRGCLYLQLINVSHSQQRVNFVYNKIETEGE